MTNCFLLRVVSGLRKITSQIFFPMHGLQLLARGLGGMILGDILLCISRKGKGRTFSFCLNRVGISLDFLFDRKLGVLAFLLFSSVTVTWYTTQFERQLPFHGQLPFWRQLHPSWPMSVATWRWRMGCTKWRFFFLYFFCILVVGQNVVCRSSLGLVWVRCWFFTT